VYVVAHADAVTAINRTPNANFENLILLPPLSFGGHAAFSVADWLTLLRNPATLLAGRQSNSLRARSLQLPVLRAHLPRSSGANQPAAAQLKPQIPHPQYTPGTLAIQRISHAQIGIFPRPVTAAMTAFAGHPGPVNLVPPAGAKNSLRFAAQRAWWYGWPCGAGPANTTDDRLNSCQLAGLPACTPGPRAPFRAVKVAPWHLGSSGIPAPSPGAGLEPGLFARLEKRKKVWGGQPSICYTAP
jgi:hypothetical protein